MMEKTKLLCYNLWVCGDGCVSHSHYPWKGREEDAAPIYFFEGKQRN